MTKTIETLVQDINEVISGNGGWDTTLSNFFGTSIAETAYYRFNPSEGEQRNRLGLSSMGTPCSRQLWYKANNDGVEYQFQPHEKLKFFYGDMLEELIITLAKAAGHTVEGLQSTLKVGEITGHRDCVIDGITVDIKSASPYSFKKFKENKLREDDPFGYISQLSSYVYAGSKDGSCHPTRGAFLVVNKVSGQIHLDEYDLTEEVQNKEQEIQDKVDMTKLPEPPERTFEAIPQSKTSPNEKLGVNCSYCMFKKQCWPDMRVFLYSYGPQYLTKVDKEPNVFEISVEEAEELK
jgi:hypothetical protein